MPSAPIEQVRNGKVDYLMMDYLAEVTMSIMQKQKQRNPDFGYARDFVDVVTEILPEISKDGVKVVSNAGGVNPLACKDEILKQAKAAGVHNIKVAVVHGDDILDQIDDLIASGNELKNMDDGRPLSEIKDNLLSANVYFGAQPIVDALADGANIVITGRVTDTGLCLGPMIHEFGWSFDDYDKMATGTIAGHILECGAQSSGGNFTDWEKVGDFTNIGFPIVEAHKDGTFYVTKHEETGGLVSVQTVKEQLLYEIGDPKEYITPDCVADFTTVQLQDESKNRVKVWGIKGFPDTPFYKVSASYKYGYKMSSTLVYCWPDALKKAHKAGEILKQRADKHGLKFNDYRVEYIGFNGCNETPVNTLEDSPEANEIQVRVSAFSENKDDLNRFGREIAPLILTGPGGVTGFAGGRPKASDVVAYWPALIDKKACTPKVEMFSI